MQEGDKLEYERGDDQWAAKCSRFVHEAKALGHIIRVRYGFLEQGRVYEGQIYRNSYDRLNVIPLNRNNANGRTEAYYFKLDLLEVLGPLPEGLPELHGDWDYYTEEGKRY